MLCGVLVTSLFLSQPVHASAAAFNWGNFYTQIYQGAGVYFKDSLLSQAWDFTKDLVILKMVDTVCSDESSLSQDAKDILKSKYYNTDSATWDSAVVDDTLFTDHFQNVYINNGVIDNTVVNDVLSTSKQFLDSVGGVHVYPTRKVESLSRLVSYQTSEDMAYINQLYDSCCFAYYRNVSDKDLYISFMSYPYLLFKAPYLNGVKEYYIQNELKQNYKSNTIAKYSISDMPTWRYEGGNSLVGKSITDYYFRCDLSLSDASSRGYLFSKTGEPIYYFDSSSAFESFLMGDLPAYQSEYYLNYSSDDNRTYYYDSSYNPVTYSSAYETINNNIVNNTSNDTYYNIINNYYQENDAEPSPPSGDGGDSGNGGGSGGSGILDLISGIGSVFDLILSVIGNIIELATGIIKQIFDIVTGLLEKVQSGVGSLGTIISDFFPFIPAEIMSCITLGIVLYILVGIIKKITK